MISSSSFTAMFFTLMAAILVPITVLIYTWKKYSISIKAVGVGALIFFVFQIFTRIPLLSFLGGQEWYATLMQNVIFASLFLSLSAGLFEEIGRYIGFRYMLQDNLAWKNGIAYGIGHGGFESITLVGLTHISNIILAFMINNGTFASFFVPQVGNAAAEAIKANLTGTAPYIFALAGVERILVFIIQIALSLVVLYAVINKKPLYLLYAILLHALVNIPAVIFSMKSNSIVYAEISIAIFAIISLVFIKRSRHIFDTPQT